MSQRFRTATSSTTAYVLLSLAMAMPGASDAEAQPDIFGAQRSAWGPRLDTIGVAASSRVLWRGHDLGAGAHAALSLGVYGRSVSAAGTWHVTALANALAVDRRRDTDSRAEAALEVGRQFGSDGATAAVSAGGYRVTGDSDDHVGAEFSIRLDDLPIPFVPEVWPTVHVRAARTTGPWKGTWLGAAVRQQVGLRQYAIRFEVGADIDDAARSSFTAPRWRAEAGAAKGFDRWLVQLEGGLVRSDGSTLGRGAIGLSWRY